MSVSSAGPSPRRGGLFSKLGLNRSELRAWALYDWANSGFATSIMGAILPIYFVRVAASDIPLEARTAYWGYTQTVALVIIAVISPVLGAVADFLGAKKKFLARFASLGAVGCVLLYWVRDGDWFFASAAFIIGNIGYAAVTCSMSRYCLTSRARTRSIRYPRPATRSAMSAAACCLPCSSRGLAGLVPSASKTRRRRRAGPSSAWAFGGSRSRFRLCEASRNRIDAERLERKAAIRLVLGSGESSIPSKSFDNTASCSFSAAPFWFYNDGINTIIKMASAFGTEVGIAEGHLIGAFLLVQFLGSRRRSPMGSWR